MLSLHITYLLSSGRWQGGNKFPRAAATITNVGYARLKGEKNTWLAGLHEVTGYGNLRMTNGQKATLIGLEIPNYILSAIYFIQLRVTLDC